MSTIESYLAALRHFRLLADPTCLAPSFYTPHMKVLLRGIKRVHCQQQAAPRIRLPITSSLMRRLKAHLSKDPSRYTNCLIWAAACTGFFGFLRCGEFVVPDGIPFHPSQHLCLEDISFRQESPQWFFLVNVKISKTDQFRQGAQVVLGATGTDLCPVAALLDYLSARGPRAGPLFVLEDGEPLRRSLFVKHVQEALEATGLCGTHFKGHSFRIGAATSASAAGVPESTIKILGRWKSLAYQQYIRPSVNDLARVSSMLGTLDHAK